MEKQLTGYNEEQLEEMAKEAKRAYDRKWRKDHPEKVKLYNQRYFARRYLESHKAAPEDEAGGE